MKKIKNPMTIKDLSSMYKVSPSKISVLVGRAEFAKFDLGKIELARANNRYTMKVQCYDCTEKFDALMKLYLSSTKRIRR